MGARTRCWVLGGTAAVLLVVASSLAPNSLQVGILEDVLSAAAAGALWVGARRQTEGARRDWSLVALAVTAWVVGDLVWDGYTALGIERPDVSVSDAWYMAAYPLLAFGVMSMARRRARGQLREGLLDSCIFAASMTIMTWQLLVVPIAAQTHSWTTSVVWSAYPLLDVLLLGAVAWLVFAPGSRSIASALFVASLVIWLVADVLYSSLPTWTSIDTSRIDPLYPIGYALMAAAALHPASAEITQPGPASHRTHPARFVILAMALCGAVIVALCVKSDDVTSRLVLVSLGIALSILVVGRFALEIREREVVEDQLVHRSTHDELTGVVNRVLLMDRIDHALQRAARQRSTVAVLYLDLDHFKAINDTYGHDVGDDLLIEVTRRISDLLRPSDTVGRLGGDEFLVVCEDLAVGDVVRVAERLIGTIAAPTSLASLALQITTSIGIAVCVDGTGSVDALVRDADAAMYEVKRRGGNSYELYDADLRATFARRREIEDALRDATATGELVLLYQPIVRARDETVSGFEALLRWQRSDGTLLEPAEFIRIAEETGTIVPIGTWVIEQACHKLAAWELDGIEDPTISINVSALQFRHETLLHDLKRALALSGAHPSRLTLEITESLLVSENDHVIEQLEVIRQLGVRVAIDDFGTGYSGLSYLHRLPIDIIKIDRSFVAELDTDPGATTVLHAVVALAHALGLEIVAEGAETAQQTERLRALDCDHIQGFYFAQPTGSQQADRVARSGLRHLDAPRRITSP
ncbi:MAG: putative bifunctional diguanylate cyclase/phosphodiesterase [Microthrixaceae bacterium]